METSLNGSLIDSAHGPVLEIALPLISHLRGEPREGRVNNINSILNLELSMLSNNFIHSSGLEINEDELTIDDLDELISMALAAEEIELQRNDERNATTPGVPDFRSVVIRNESDHLITEEVIAGGTVLSNNVDVFIYHVHTTESFTPCDEFYYEMTGNFRTLESNFNITRVGRDLASHLELRGFNVEQDITIHDFPAFSGSYTRGLETATRRLEGRNTQIIIDLHRDAIGDNEARRINLNGEYVAQIMFVVRHKSAEVCITQIGKKT